MRPVGCLIVRMMSQLEVVTKPHEPSSRCSCMSWLAREPMNTVAGLAAQELFITNKVYEALHFA